MERLTKKDDDGQYFSIAESKTFDEEQQCINKLGQLEDILEEYDMNNLVKLSFHLDLLREFAKLKNELGIDALLYLKVMSHQVVYIKGKEPEWGGFGDESEIESYHVMRFTKDRLEVRFTYSDTYATHIIKNPLNSYGKVWAVTKEELL